MIDHMVKAGLLEICRLGLNGQGETREVRDFGEEPKRMRRALARV